MAAGPGSNLLLECVLRSLGLLLAEAYLLSALSYIMQGRQEASLAGHNRLIPKGPSGGDPSPESSQICAALDEAG